jgi:signal peptidase I
MSLLSRRRSFAEAVEGRRRLGRRFAAVFAVFLSFELVSSLFLTAFSAGSSSMSPTILPGDRLLAFPLAFGPRTLFGKLPGVSRPERGDLAVVDPPFAPEPGFWKLIGDAATRFLTLQILSLDGSRADRALMGPSIQRVIGLPGDVVEMRDFVFMVKPAGSDAVLTEFELSKAGYDISKRGLPENWSASLPGSGDMAPITLGKDEYFVAGDARSASSDSRLWGPVKLERFRSRIALRYWPLARFGSP